MANFFKSLGDHKSPNEPDSFYIASNTGFEGEFNVDWSYHDKFSQEADAIEPLTPTQMSQCGCNPGVLQNTYSYDNWFAIIKFNQTANVPYSGEVSTKSKLDDSESTGKYTVYPIYLTDALMTPIETINADKASGMRTLKCTRYYNMMGVESTTPFQGVNIIVKEYTDGSRESSKVILR